MNTWFTVGVKYTKQQDDGSFKRVSEPYLLAAMNHGDAEARIYEELGSQIRGEFIVNKVSKTEVHDIFAFGDTDTWYKVHINYQVQPDDGVKSTCVKQNFLVSAGSTLEANQRIIKCLEGLMMDYAITKVELSPIIDVFPFPDKTE